MELDRALKLTPNLFTPLVRTPWGGQEIAKRFKQKWVKDPFDTTIGESWEVSCDPAFPSQVIGLQTSLLDLIRAEPERMLSPEYVRSFGPNCDILVKLINAAQPLSLQVHPTDDDPDLKIGECGKPESWLVLHADPGAGLYLGFAKPVSKVELEKVLLADGDLRPYLQFVPVNAGDYFEISPGVVHAIGPGVTLLEPQRVRLGKAGKTYRFWDWSRRYNPNGSPNNESGQARELHIQEGLKLVHSDKQFGADYLSSLRGRAERFALSDKITHDRYPANDNYQVHRLHLQGGSQVQLSAQSGFLTFVCLGGEGDLGKGVNVSRGEPGFVPFEALPLSIHVAQSVAEDFDMAIIVPPRCDLKISVL